MTQANIASPTPPYKLAITAIQQALNWYNSQRRHWNYPPNLALQTAVRPELQTMKQTLAKLEQKRLTVATFGLVSRGKSSVINALLGEKRLETGPLHGVTQWPQTIRWVDKAVMQIELVDTPGLDEIAGEARSEMAKSVAQQADLLLFIVAGDITQTEFIALQTLRQAQKPMLLVFNKIDLYPEQDQAQIFAQLQSLTPQGETVPIFSANDIVLCAAQPQSIRVKVEYPDCPSEEGWETPPPQMEALQNRLLDVFNRDGLALLAHNALRQVETAEKAIAQKTVEHRHTEAEGIINRVLRYKGLAIAVNPILGLDLVGSVVADLVLIRRLAQLYGLPITSFQSGRLWKKIAIGTAGVLLTPLIYQALSGTTSLTAAWESQTLLSFLLGNWLLQGGIAAYSTCIVGQATQTYLTQGATWGNQGTSAVLRQLLAQLPAHSILWQLSPESPS